LREFFKKLMGRDSTSRWFKDQQAVKDSRQRLSHILGHSIWQDGFEEERKQIQVLIDETHTRLLSAVVHGNWHARADAAVEAQRRRQEARK
jgi:hypothetical protein